MDRNSNIQFLFNKLFTGLLAVLVMSLHTYGQENHFGNDFLTKQITIKPSNWDASKVMEYNLYAVS